MSGFKNALYCIVCKFMDVYTPSGSGFSIIKRNDENCIKWCIDWHAFNYHDESWHEYEDLTVNIFDNANPDTNGFAPLESMTEFSDCKFYELLTEFVKNSSSVLVCNRGSHTEEKKSGYSFYYRYDRDIEFIFKNLYESGTSVSLRYAEYNDRY